MQSTRKTAKKTATVWGSLKTNRLRALKQKKHIRKNEAYRKEADYLFLLEEKQMPHPSRFKILPPLRAKPNPRALPEW
jgi:hypothetical protein